MLCFILHDVIERLYALPTTTGRNFVSSSMSLCNPKKKHAFYSFCMPCGMSLLYILLCSLYIMSVYICVLFSWWMTSALMISAICPIGLAAFPLVVCDINVINFLQSMGVLSFINYFGVVSL